MTKKSVISFLAGLATCLVIVACVAVVRDNQKMYGTWSAPSDDVDPNDFLYLDDKLQTTADGDWVRNDGSVHEVHLGQHDGCDVCNQVVIDKAIAEAQAEEERYQRSLEADNAPLGGGFDLTGPGM